MFERGEAPPGGTAGALGRAAAPRHTTWYSRHRCSPLVRARDPSSAALKSSGSGLLYDVLGSGSGSLVRVLWVGKADSKSLFGSKMVDFRPGIARDWFIGRKPAIHHLKALVLKFPMMCCSLSGSIGMVRYSLSKSGGPGAMPKTIVSGSTKK